MTLKTYPQVVNFLLCTCSTDENRAETEDENTVVAKSPNKTPLKCAEKFVARAFRDGDVYEEYDLNEIFMKGLDTSIRQSIKGYKASGQSASLNGVAFYATLLLKLYCEQQGTSDS